MAFIFSNPNPHGIKVGDCVIRAISIVLGQSWEQTYADLALQGYVMADMPSSNNVWSAYLRSKGFVCEAVAEPMTIADFADEKKEGSFLAATGTHVVAVIDGNYYDAWDSGDEIVSFYFYKEV